jgi:protein associated with RNAse G/E
MSELFRVEALTPQGELKYRWQAELLDRSKELLLLRGAWERLLEHADEPATPITNQSLEFYWPDRLYTISALFDEKGSLREFYGRVILPINLDAKTKKITITLIGPDLQITPSGQYDVLDLPYQATPEQEERYDLGQGWLDLVGLVERREGPFDPAFFTPYRKKIKKIS